MVFCFDKSIPSLLQITEHLHILKSPFLQFSPTFPVCNQNILLSLMPEPLPPVRFFPYAVKRVGTVFILRLLQSLQPLTQRFK